MTQDALKDLLNAAPSAQVPAHDLAFSIEVMAKVERKRLMENVLWTLAAAVFACLVLALVMPYLTPALGLLGEALLPAAVLLSLVGAGLFGIEQTRRYVKFG